MPTIFEEVAQVPHDAFVYKPRTGENTKAIQNAINKYASGCRLENVLFHYDYTIMGNGAKGMLITWDAVYNSSMRGVVIRFDDIKDMHIKQYEDYQLTITTADGKAIKFNTFGKAAYCLPVLQLVMKYRQQLAANSAANPAAGSAASATTAVKAPSAAPDPQKIAADRKAALPVLYKYVEQVPHRAYAFKPRSKENTAAIQNAIAKYAKDCRLEDVILFFDYTIMGNGKKGILITWDKVYSSAGSCIAFDDIVTILKPTDDQFQLQINTGKGFVKFPTFDPNDQCYDVLKLVQKYRAADVSLQMPQVQRQTGPTQRQFIGQNKVAELAADVQKLKNIGYHVTFVPRNKENAAMIQTAISIFAKGCDKEDIALFYDCSTFRNGKDGIILTWDGIYANWADRKEKFIPYDDILEIRGASGELKTTLYIKTKKDRLDTKLEMQIDGNYLIDTIKQVKRYRAQLMLKFPRLFLRPEPEDPVLEGAYGAFFDKVKALSGTERLWYHPVTDKNKAAVWDAIKAYGGSMKPDEVLLYYEDDLYKTSKQGVLLGKDRFFTSKHLGGIAYDDIMRLQIPQGTVLTVEITRRNGDLISLSTFHDADKFIQVLKLTIEYAVSLNEEKNRIVAPAETPAPQAESEPVIMDAATHEPIVEEAAEQEVPAVSEPIPEPQPAPEPAPEPQPVPEPQPEPIPEPEPYEPIFEPVFVDHEKSKKADMSVVTRRAKPKPKAED